MATMHISTKLLESWDPETASWPKGTYISKIGPSCYIPDIHEGDFIEYIVTHPDLKGISLVSPIFELEDGHVRFKDWGI